MPTLSVYIDEATERRLAVLSEEMGRTVADLAECAISETVLNSFRHRKDDPATRRPKPGCIMCRGEGEYVSFGGTTKMVRCSCALEQGGSGNG